MKESNYVLLYAEKKIEDNIIITNMFKHSLKINIGWTEADFKYNVKLIESYMEQNEIQQFIFSGLEVGWNKLIKYLKEKNPKYKVKVICNTNDSLLYYEYERNNFFELLELSKGKVVDEIAFFRKGQYEVYKSLGYSCSLIVENYILDNKKRKTIKKPNDVIDIGIYPLNYTWDKNIFNQLCIPKFVENSNLNFNDLDLRMEEFLSTMKINCKKDKIKRIDDISIINTVIKNDVVVSSSFTEYVHPIFFICMELGIPCIIGNTSDLFEENEEIINYVVTSAEDNAIINAKIVKKALENKEKIQLLYANWKEKHNKKSEISVLNFLTK